MRRLSLPVLALSLVIVGCGEEEPKPLPKQNTTAGTMPITSKETENGSPVAANPPAQSKQPDAKPPVTTEPVPSQSQPQSHLDEPLASNSQKSEQDKQAAEKLREQFDQEFKATKDLMVIAPRLTTGWLTTPIKPETIAQEMEKQLASTKNVSGESRIQLDVNGAKGMSLANLAIQDSKKFYVEYARIRREPSVDVQKEVLVGDGMRYATNALAKSGWSEAQPISNLKLEDHASMENWATEFPRRIYSALQGGKPISHLLAEARKQGLEIDTEETYKTNQAAQQVRQYRILITRSAADTEKKGKMIFEIVVDGYRKMPMHVRANIDPPKGSGPEAKPTMVWWMARWNLDPNQKLANQSFVIPGRAAQKIANGTKL